MSVSSEVQRTLVKSPPELWAELSDPVSLARHLGELGEVRITRVEPEKTVEWEAADAAGAVLLKPSGWGTKVTLTVTREVPEPEPEPVALEPVALEPESTPVQEPEPTPVQEPEPIPRRGFFARVFGRRPKVEPQPEPEPELQENTRPNLAAELATLQENTQPNLAAELAALEESLVAETRAVLTTVLDRLGAAHHRPFSRS